MLFRMLSASKHMITPHADIFNNVCKFGHVRYDIGKDPGVSARAGLRDDTSSYPSAQRMR